MFSADIKIISNRVQTTSEESNAKRDFWSINNIFVFKPLTKYSCFCISYYWDSTIANRQNKNKDALMDYLLLQRKNLIQKVCCRIYCLFYIFLCVVFSLEAMIILCMEDEKYYGDFIIIFSDSWDDLWDWSSNDEDGEETESDTCVEATILQRVQRQENINKVVESFTKHFGGNNKKGDSNANSIILKKSPPLSVAEEGNLNEQVLILWQLLIYLCRP